MTRGLRHVGAVLIVGLLGTVPALLGAAPALAAGGVTYSVAVGGTATCSAGQQQGANFGTVQAALDCALADNPPAASPDTVEVAAGTYTANIAIYANVNLVGASAATTILDGGGTGTVVTVGTGTTVSISNVTIEHGAATGGAGGAGGAATGGIATGGPGGNGSASGPGQDGAPA
ncbi:MAG TPA: hypothetical protein VFN57_02940, partial [Thermomicrobiaceae bacterium]|nr:hypothetical protein [Thermomicrobiaceae bacterium]